MVVNRMFNISADFAAAILNFGSHIEFFKLVNVGLLLALTVVVCDALVTIKFC